MQFSPTSFTELKCFCESWLILTLGVVTVKPNLQFVPFETFTRSQTFPPTLKS